MPPGMDDVRARILQPATAQWGRTSDRACSGEAESRQGWFLIVGFSQEDAARVAAAAAPWRTEVAEATSTLREVAEWLRQREGCVVGLIVAVRDGGDLARASGLWMGIPTAAVITLGPPLGLAEMVDAFRSGVHEHVVEARISELAGHLDRAAARALATARLAERKFRVLFNAMGAGAILSDRDGRVLEMNASAQKYLRLTLKSGPSEGLGDDAVPGLARVLREATVGEQSEAEIELPDGSCHTFGYSTTESPSGQFRVTLLRDLAPNLAFERRRRRAEQLAQVGEMAARLSHEIKNPLASVLAGLELLGEQATLDDSHGEVLREVTR